MTEGSESPKHIHVVGICGVATSAIALAFHKKGWKVTGSDKGFFPPVSTELEKAGIPFYAGWHPEKMVENGTPDAVMIGNASGSQNPETLYARDHDIPSYSYPEIIGTYFLGRNSIVCIGTWGKTSSSALLSHILDAAGLDPSYMFGGVSLSHEVAARIGGPKWSVVEGDEYRTSPTDTEAKFFHYRPTRLLLTAVSWDHADMYPTEDSYFDAFKTLVSRVPISGTIVANSENKGIARVLGSAATSRIIRYGRDFGDYTYADVKQTEDGLTFSISFDGSLYDIASPMLGAFQAENITGCFAMAHEIGIPPEKIVAAIASFKGLKRRLEKRRSGDVSVIDDIAHSPEKASSVISNLSEIYSGKITAVFEPNIGGRRIESIAKYDDAFAHSGTVIIPRLTKLKVSEDGSEMPLEGDELARAISKTHPDTLYIDDDDKLVEYLIRNTKKGDVIAFLGSHGFRGMIEETVKRLS